ncbi:MAG: PHP domain-containing protein [Lachnospiraceae bacterium]|nr:PHP domain-containing protein [Lachnospiraceae bacterium]
MGYLYETHLHTYPVSACGKASVRETVDFYKSMNYDGIFITNHFIGANINISADTPYQDQLTFYCSDYYKALEYGNTIGLKVFFGVEMSQRFENTGNPGGTDFLIYGLSPDWYQSHPELMTLELKERLALMSEDGATIVHAHPFLEASYIDHIRLYPRSVHAVEIFNATKTPLENHMAAEYAKSYELLISAGSDNHRAGNINALGGIMTEQPICSEIEFCSMVRNRLVTPFRIDMAAPNRVIPL